jgi:hypothetical protein
MTKLVEIKRLLVQKIQNLEKETNIDPIELPKTSKVEKNPINNIQKIFGCLIVIQITRVVTTNNKVKRNLNNVLIIN